MFFVLPVQAMAKLSRNITREFMGTSNIESDVCRRRDTLESKIESNLYVTEHACISVTDEVFHFEIST